MNKAHFNCFIMPLLCWILEGDNASLIKRETFAVDKKKAQFPKALQNLKINTIV